MNHDRFDTISRLFAGRRLSRGQAVRGLGGLAAEGAAGLMGRYVAAQETTPVASPVTTGPGFGQEFLFVQTFEGGTWTPKPGQDEVYTLTLTGSTAQTIYFSDRPERVVGTQSMPDFLSALGFSPDNPPNAALVAQTDAGEDVLVMELFSPVYDESAATLSYDAHVLQDYDEEGLRFLADRQDDLSLPASFGSVSLFIDDCPDGGADCYVKGNPPRMLVQGVSIGCCYTFPQCHPCSANNDDLCNQQIEECYDNCFMENQACCPGQPGLCL